MDFEINEGLPSLAEYQTLRAAVGWPSLPGAIARGALDQSLFGVTAVAGGRAVGMARVIGDGVYFYVQDVIVRPDCQGHGIGRFLMDRVNSFLSTVPVGGFVGLFAARGTAGFYVRFGFRRRPTDRPGMYLSVNP